MKKAIIYARYSKTQNCKEQIQKQVTCCERFAENYGFEAVRDYVDIDKLHKKRNNRCQLKKMLKDGRKKKWEAVLVCGIDRITRDYKQYVKILKELENVGVKIINCSGGDEE